MARYAAWAALGLAAALWVGGCAFLPVAGDLGVTAGGAQDMAQARAIIQSGGIPSPEAVTVEGLLSEHSIAVAAPPNAELLYVSAAVAWAGDYQSFVPMATVAVGFGTTLDMESFARAPQNLCLVIDRSGSMNELIDNQTSTSKMTAVKVAIDRLLVQLTAADRVSMVTFNQDAKLILNNAAGNDIAAIKQALDGITAKGTTHLSRGLERGYKAVKANRTSERQDRIIVFTDAIVTAGKTQAKDFLKEMNTYAKDGIGTTILGVGYNLDAELVNEISRVRGGNYYFLSDYQRLVTVFDDEFDFMVTPVAHDVKLTASIPFVFDVHDVYGVQSPTVLTHQVTLDIHTLFLSSRQGGGAVVIRLRPSALVDFSTINKLADMTFAFTTTDGLQKSATLSPVLPGGLDASGGVRHFENESARRAVLLTNIALTLNAALQDVQSSWYPTYSPANPQAARQRLTEFLPYFDELAEGLTDRPTERSRSLSEEREVVVQLLANVLTRYNLAPLSEE